MECLTGVWRPISRQTVPGKTPIHGVKKNQMADIIINEDGVSGYMERRKMFGRVVHEEVLVTEFETDNLYAITHPESGVVMLAMIDEDGKLITKWNSSVKAIDGWCVVYERQ